MLFAFDRLDWFFFLDDASSLRGGPGDSLAWRLIHR
jgi:hypothetical protein